MGWMIAELIAMGVMSPAVVINEEEGTVSFLGDIAGTKVPGMANRLQEIAGLGATPVHFSLDVIPVKEEPCERCTYSPESRPLLLSIGSS